MEEDTAHSELEVMNLGLKDLSKVCIPVGCSSLTLHGNLLSSLHGLEGAHAIVDLNLSSNAFQSMDLPELAFLSELQILDMSGNEISSLLEAPFLPGLFQLSVSYNNLHTLAGIGENFPDLEKLDVRGNYLSDSIAVSDLASLENLQHLLLGGGSDPNPICSNASAVLMLFNVCHALKSVDSLDRKRWEDAVQTATKKEVSITHDVATSPLILLAEPNNSDQTSVILVDDNELETPRFDVLAQRFRAKVLQRSKPQNTARQLDDSAFAVDTHESPNMTVDIVDVFMQEIGSPSATPQSSPESCWVQTGTRKQNVEHDDYSPNPRDIHQPFPQPSNPWVGAVVVEASAVASKPTTPTVDPALAADMRSLLGALRVSGLPSQTVQPMPEVLSAPLNISLKPHVEPLFPHLLQSLEEPELEPEPITPNSSPRAPVAVALGSRSVDKLLQDASSQLLVCAEPFSGLGENISRELENARMRIAHLETIIADATLSTMAATEASATSLREIECRINLAEKDLQVERSRAEVATLSETKVQLENQELVSKLDKKINEAELASTRADDLARQVDALSLLHNEEKRRFEAEYAREKQVLQASNESMSSNLEDITSKFNALATENSSLLRSIAVACQQEEEQQKRIDSLSHEVGKCVEINEQLKAAASVMTKEQEESKKITDSRMLDWERILSSHADMLTQERAQSNEISLENKLIREHHHKLERRFKQLEHAFEQALLRSDDLVAELVTERENTKQSHMTVAELGDGIRKLQAALHRALDHKRSALQLKQALLQAHALNESLALQLNVAQQLADQSREETTNERAHCNRSNDRVQESMDAPEYRRQIEDVESKLRVKADLLNKAADLTELLTRKADELAHTVQVKDVVINDQADTIVNLKERINVAEVDLSDAENIITGLEEQLDDARREIDNLEKAAEEHADAEAQLRAMIVNYRSAVRSQLDEVDNDSEDSEED